MPDKKPAKKAGRPKADIDWTMVCSFLQRGDTGKYIADKLHITYETLTNRCKIDNKIDFYDFKKQKRAIGDDALEIKAYDLAMKGDRALLIFLLKNRKGMKDNPETINDEDPKDTNLSFDGWK